LSSQIVIFLLVALFSVVGFCILLGVYLYSVLATSSVKERLGRYVESPPEETHVTQPVMRHAARVSGFRNNLNNVLSVLTSKKLQQKLLSSNWQITVTEYVLIQIVSGVFGLILGWVISKHFILGLFVGVTLYLLPGLFLQQSIYKRQKKFQDQLVDVLVLIRGAVQAGFSLLQSLEVVVREMPAPAGEEFARVQREVQFGIPLSQSLESLSTRMESDDLQMVVTAIIINSQVGGNLSLMLTAVTETIRNRIALLGEVRALTSYARYASYLLTFLPFITAVLIFFLSPGYFSGSLDSPITRILFLVALIGILLGNIWLRRLAHIVV
jgi:tight adherence protein B